MYKKWKPSKSKAREFAQQMNEIDEFCAKNGIQQSATSDSYYFSINGINYRVSNHTIEQSNKRAYNANGEQVRQKYHNDERDAGTVYITASKTRIKDIFTALKAGKKLDKRGCEI